jgi:hypothetical protein
MPVPTFSDLAATTRRALRPAAIAIFLSALSCQSETPAAGPQAGSGGMTGVVTGSGGAAVEAGGGGSGGMSVSGGPVTDSSSGLRAGLQANGSITYVRNK